MTDNTLAPTDAENFLAQIDELVAQAREDDRLCYDQIPSQQYADARERIVSAVLAKWGAPPSAAPVDAALIEFIEKCGEVCFQRVREGFKGPKRWDIEFIVPGGDREVRGKTLSDAITKAIAARAAQGGVV